MSPGVRCGCPNWAHVLGLFPLERGDAICAQTPVPASLHRERRAGRRCPRLARPRRGGWTEPRATVTERAGPLEEQPRRSCPAWPASPGLLAFSLLWESLPQTCQGVFAGHTWTVSAPPTPCCHCAEPGASLLTFQAPARDPWCLARAQLPGAGLSRGPACLAHPPPKYSHIRRMRLRSLLPVGGPDVTHLTEVYFCQTLKCGQSDGCDVACVVSYVSLVTCSTVFEAFPGFSRISGFELCSPW